MTHPCVVSTTNTLSLLRTTDLTGPFEPDVPLSPDVYFSADTVQGMAQITLHPLEGGLVKAGLEVTGDPEWLSLNIGLGTGSFQTGDTVGIVADTRGSDSFATRPVLRSSRANDETVDTCLAEDFIFGGLPGTMILLHPVTTEDALAYGEAFHTLILPLPKRNISLTLNDLRLVHLDASSGIDLQAMTLGGLAV